MRSLSYFFGIAGLFGLVACSSAGADGAESASAIVGGPGAICEHAAPPMGCTYKHVGPGACDDRLVCATFEGNGAAQVRLGSVDSQLLGASADVTSLTKEMTDANPIQNDVFRAGSYASSPELVTAFRADNTIAYDLMFRLDGSAPGASKGFGWARQYQARYETLSCSAVAVADAASTFTQFEGYQIHQGDDQIAESKRALIKSDAEKLVSSFAEQASSTAELYNCRWDNNDDSASDALVLIDDNRVHVVMVFKGG